MAKKDKAGFDPVEAFRRQSSRKKSEDTANPILKREWATIVSLSLLIIVAPWMLGSMRWLPQTILFSLSLVAFITLFIPAADREQLPLQNLKRLLRFPVFWLGGLFLLYILIQALNPALEIKHKDMANWVAYGSAWWIGPLKHIDWLPTGIDAPFHYGNTWRSLMIWATPVLAVWAAWAGLRQRRSVIALFWVICLNGAVLALVGMLMVFSGTELLLWTFPSSNLGFFGPFHYGNHSAAYLYPILALCLGMFFYYSQRARRYMLQSNPSFFFLLLAGLIAAGLMVNLSRGGIIMTAGIVVPFICLYLLSLMQSKSVKSYLVGVAVLVLVIAGTVFATVQFVGIKTITDEFAALSGKTEKRDESVAMRLMLMEATSEMYLDRPLYGWGAGSYRWVFRNYQLKKEYEKLWRPFRAWHITAQIHNAHSDILQFPAELGSVGAGMLVAILLYWLGAALSFMRAISFEHIMIAVGPVMSLVHAIFEFNLSNPAVLILFSLIIALTVLWLRLNPRFQKAA